MKLQDLHFELPDEKAAHMPAEALSGDRSDVKLMVIHRDSGLIEHRRFVDLPEYLRPRDVLVLNASATLPSQFIARDDQGREIKVRLSSRDPASNGKADKWYAVFDPDQDIARGARLTFTEGADAPLVAVVDARHPNAPKLWRLAFELNGTSIDQWRRRLAQPVRYHYVPDAWGIEYYQNVYAQFPGSSEMPSAGRAFTPEILAGLHERGIGIVRIVLHTGVSNIDIEEERIDQHRMYEEEYQLSEEAAQIINHARSRGGRVFAVGTTVVRTLETVANASGNLEERSGWTSLYIQPGYRFKVVDALLTGFHEARSTRLVLAVAFAGDKDLVLRAYHEALERDYRWHEFGDLTLIV
jgi:S-adenosylmethionine:tRNA ribosyltransferase-isomerase